MVLVSENFSISCIVVQEMIFDLKRTLSITDVISLTHSLHLLHTHMHGHTTHTHAFFTHHCFILALTGVLTHQLWVARVVFMEKQTKKKSSTVCHCMLRRPPQPEGWSSNRWRPLRPFMSCCWRWELQTSTVWNRIDNFFFFYMCNGACMCTHGWCSCICATLLAE